MQKKISFITSALSNHSWRHILASFSWLFFERVLAVGLTLLSSILLVRYLGPAQYGTISFAAGIFTMLAAFCRLGLDNIVVREIVLDSSKQPMILGSAFLMKIVTSGVCLLVMMLIFGLDMLFTLDEVIILIICMSLLFQPFVVIDLYFQTETKSKYVAIARACGMIMSALLKLACIYYKLSLYWVAFAVTCEHVVQYLLLNIIYVAKSHSPLSWKVDFQVAKKLLKSSLLLLLSAISVNLYLKIDLVMIKYMLGNAQVGKYAAAAQLSEGWYFIPQILVISLFPSIIKVKQNSEENYYKRLQQLMYFMVVLSGSLAIMISITSDFLVDLLYGSNYKETSEVLVIHIWSGLFVFMGFVAGRWLIIEGMEYQAFKRSLGGMLINVALNFVLIPLYGIKGAAIATLVATATSHFLAYFFDIRTRKIFVMECRALFQFYKLFKR